MKHNSPHRTSASINKFIITLTMSVIGLFLCFSLMTQAYGKDNSLSFASQKTLSEINTFYHTPRFGRYQKLLSAIVGIKKNNQFAPNLGVFSVMVIATHPNYTSLLQENFSKYNVLTQRYVLSILLATNHLKITDQLASQYHQKPLPQKFMTPSTIENLLIKNGEDLDYLWAAYFATGDMKFVKKIIVFINHDPFELMLGYEITNRFWMCEVMRQSGKPITKTCLNFTDLMKTTKAKYPLSFHRVFSEATVVSAALWSVDGNSRQDKLLKANIDKLFKISPKLNYWDKIKSVYK